MKEKVGFQDQCAAAFGGLVIIEAKGDSITPRKFIVSNDYIDYICSNLLLGFDGVERYSSKSSAIITKNIRSDLFNSQMNLLSEVSDEGINAFSAQQDIDVHAEITKESRKIKVSMNGDQQNYRNIQLIEATERAGSLCTRIMGAGGGGFFACWAPPSSHQSIKDSVNIKTWVDVKFSKAGSQVIFQNESI